MFAFLRVKNSEVVMALLFVVALFLLYLNVTPHSGNANSCYPRDYGKNETIYSQINCSDCNCVDDGKQLFTFLGSEATCEDAKTEQERASCYYLNSYPVYECQDYDDQAKYEECIKKYRNELFEYNLGEGGSLAVKEGVFSKGDRTYFTGFDNQGKHRIKTGFTEFFSDAIILRRGNGDAQLGGNLTFVKKKENNVYFLSPNSGIYLAGEPEYKMDANGDLVRKSERMSTGIETGDYDVGDLFFMANGNSLARIYNSLSTEMATSRSILANTAPMAMYYLLFEKSVQIGDPMNKTNMLYRDPDNRNYNPDLADWGDFYVSDDIFFRRQVLDWTEHLLEVQGGSGQDSRMANFILYVRTKPYR